MGQGMAALLALDLGTSTGWAMRADDGRIVHGTIEFRPGRFEGGGMRFLRFGRGLDEVRETAPGGIAEIHFEEVRRHRGVDAAHVYGGLMATLTAWCERHSIPYSGVPVGTWKRPLTGKGNADKAKVMEAITARGFTPDGQDDADALGILLSVEGVRHAA